MIAKPNHSNKGTPTTDSPQARWQKLCSYALRCVEAEAATSLAPYVKENFQWFIHTGEEQLVVGKTDAMQISENLAGRIRQNSRTKSIIYGWPTVVIIDRDHKPKVAPLFIVQAKLEPEQGAGNQWRLHATIEPEFNLAITASGVFDPSVTEEIDDFLSDGLPFGDADTFVPLAEKVSDLLRLKILSPLNPGCLESKMDRKQGIYNVAISVIAEWSGYTDTLRKELKLLQECEDWATTAAAHLIPAGYTQKEDRRSPSGPLAAALVCNQSQEETLKRLRAAPLTVITGPPGTGKIQIVVNAVTNAWLDGDKVLVTSTNNAAVDVAVDRAEKDVGSGLLVRTGNSSMRQQVPDRITSAMAQAAAHSGDQAEARSQLTRVATERTQLMENLTRLDELDMKLLHLVKEREEYGTKLEETAQALWHNASPPELPMSPQEIEQRAGRLLRAWLFPRFRARRFRRRLGCLEAASLEQLIIWAQLDQHIAKLTSQLEIERDERQQLEFAVGNPAITVRKTDQKWAEASLCAIRADIATRITAGTDHLETFRAAPTHGDRLKKIISNSLQYLRGWACTALTVHSSFPLESGLFDLVIVDEASQCSLATVLPLAYRAKRLAVVGDPYQLNPIVPLSDRRLQKIAAQTEFDNDALRKRGIHHKDGSAYFAFEFAAKPETPVLLNEHYRCHPQIARWFNKTFYKDELTILTDVSDTLKHDHSICWCDIAGTAEQPADGSWINRAEAERAVEQLRIIIESGYHTVGVITPFAAQAQLIDWLAKKQLDPARLDEMDFVSGTAHRLQGNEREAIIFSSVLSPDMPRTSARWIQKERNLLNVAVSRARQALIVLGHPLIGDLGSPTLASLRAYLRHEAARNEGTGSLAEFRTDSRSEKLLLNAMQLQNLSPYAKPIVEGYELDFALLEQGIKLNIEIDGDQHLDARGRQRRQDITRDRVLQNLGWIVLRIPAWQCYAEIDSVIEEIRKARDRLLPQISKNDGDS